MSSGHVFGFEAVAADGSVGAAEVARFPGLVQGAETGGNVLGKLGAGGGVDGVGAMEGFERPESVEARPHQRAIGPLPTRRKLFRTYAATSSALLANSRSHRKSYSR